MADATLPTHNKPQYSINEGHTPKNGGNPRGPVGFVPRDNLLGVFSRLTTYR